MMGDDDRAQIEAVLRRLREVPADRAPDLFVLVQRTEAGHWTVSKIRELGFEIPILGADNFSLNALIQGRPAAAAGLRASSFYAGPAPTVRGREFERAFHERTGRVPDYGDAYAYDAVRRYLDGLIADEQQIHGVAGTFVLGPDHDARGGFFIVELRDGAVTVVETNSTEQP